MAGGGDQLQMLTREFGISTGKEKYFVARSEHCTIEGVATFYDNEEKNQKIVALLLLPALMAIPTLNSL